MELIEKNDNKLSVQFSKTEFSILSACANHVLYKFAMGAEYNITEATGWKMNEAKKLAETLRKKENEIDESGILYNCKEKEFHYLIKTINDATKIIGSEFHNLTGYEIGDANLLLKEMQKSI